MPQRMQSSRKEEKPGSSKLSRQKEKRRRCNRRKAAEKCRNRKEVAGKLPG